VVSGFLNAPLAAGSIILHLQPMVHYIIIKQNRVGLVLSGRPIKSLAPAFTHYSAYADYKMSLLRLMI